MTQDHANEGAGAPASSEQDTIDKGLKGLTLRELWLPSLKAELQATEYLERARSRAYGKSSYEPLLTASVLMRRELCATVRAICERGGLLHVGVPGLSA